uniref:Uncharacterized protein MANES_06G115500 n=1 Tax=Rhizophora mucronata TaxID=61149 RepID=A0A2P2K301_RHIMU
MEVVGVFGGAARPCVPTPSVVGSSIHRTCRASSSVSCENPTKLSTSHLAAFPSPSHVFLYSPSRLHGSKALRKSTKTHIFLPQLVASMVLSKLGCLLGSNLAKPHLDF